MSIPVLLTALLALLSIPPDVHAHGYLSSPRACNWVARQEQREWDPQSLNRKPASATCGRSPSSGINYDITPGPRIEATYSCGQTGSNCESRFLPQDAVIQVPEYNLVIGDYI